jgi:hypothetical protein
MHSVGTVQNFWMLRPCGKKVTVGVLTGSWNGKAHVASTWLLLNHFFRADRTQSHLVGQQKYIIFRRSG